MKTLRTFLTHPLTRYLDLDDPQTTSMRSQIIAEKQFLHRIYEEWYGAIAMALPEGTEPVLEIGSGAGFLHECVPGLVPSDVFLCPKIRLVLDGQRLPFHSNSLRGIVMTNVLHHLPSPRQFFKEVTHCVRSQGRLVMIEPWVTRWSKLIYRFLHHEPCHPEAREWELPEGGYLSNANSALPWIIFQRDRSIFEREFTGWKIISIRPTMPFRYLVSGGVSMRTLMPAFTFTAWQALEKMLDPWMGNLAMFALIVIERI